MRTTLFSLICFVLYGCTADVYVPCNGDGPSGSPCREYRLYNEVAQGYVEFQYKGDSVVSNIYNHNSRLEKTIIERYENERLISSTAQFPTVESVVSTFHYNDSDSLFLVVHGTNDSTLQISYQNGKRHTESRLVNGETVGHKEFRYFQNGGELYRISEYGVDGELLGYRNFDYFNTNGIRQYRATLFTPDHQLVGKRLFTFSQLGLISSMEFRLADGTIGESVNYIYDSAGKLTEKNRQHLGVTSKSVYLYY